MQAAGPIHIPRVRLVADYDLNQEAAEHHGPMIEGDMAAAPYLRHKEHLDMYDEHHSAEYDADDADIKWLDNINSKVGLRSSSSSCAGEDPPPCSSQAFCSSECSACHRSPEVVGDIQFTSKTVGRKTRCAALSCSVCRMARGASWRLPLGCTTRCQHASAAAAHQTLQGLR
jgi:hypothetical protein